MTLEADIRESTQSGKNLAYFLWLTSMFLVGAAFLQANLPKGLGYLTTGATLTYGNVFLITGAGFMTPFIMGIPQLVIGIVLLKL